ncbi:MAG: carboxypeptidase-like regulatory domain-containing protein [Putridiphycobacter sp.]|nr:carboxypeptidase-like regulatory domain-containing protein [Putridiphycobacter sp.]
MKHLFITFAAVLLSFLSVAQNGVLKGEISTLESGMMETMPFAVVQVAGSTMGTRSNMMGQYQISLPAGKHIVVFSASGKERDSVEVNILANETTVLNIELKSPTLGVVEVYASAITNDGGVIAIAKEQKESEKVVTVTTSKELESKGESNVGSGAKKMTGMSTVGDVLYVRGLGDRYNVAYLNGLPVPSPNPDFRVIPLNVFPTDVVSSVSVSKVMSAELYGDFSGGAFNIITKSYLEKPTLSFSVGSGVNSQTTFKDFKTYRGGKTDYFGVDDGTRSIPEFVVNNSQASAYSAINSIYPNSFYNSVEGRSTGFLDNFGTLINKAAPNSSFSVMGGNFFDFPKSESKSSGIGFLALLNHDNSLRTSYGQIKLINAQSEERLNYDIQKYNRTTSSTGLFSLYLRMNPDNNITFNTLLVNTSIDETRDTWGQHFDYARDIYSNRLTYTQNYVSTNQLLGSHKLLKPNKDKDFSRLLIDWRGSYNLTGSKEPDRRQIVLFYDDKDATENYAFNYIDKNENHRFFSQLAETEVAGKVNTRFVAKFRDDLSENAEKIEELVVINAGIDYKSKRRDFDYKQYNYILNTLASTVGNNVDINDMNTYLNSEMHDQGQFYIQEVSNFGSSYRANLDVYGSYADVKLKLNKLELIPGVRYEISNQVVVNRNQQTPSIIERTANPATNLLPSFIAKYSASDKNVFRLVASKTVTRPKFNELAPFQYTLFFAGMKAEGNPDLQNGENYNLDVRYEHYPKPGEMITLGAFYKYLDNPIEQTMKATASGQLMSFSNALSAQVGGLELEFVRSFGSFFQNEAKRDSSFLKDFGLGVNATYMFSTVNIDTTDLTAINTNSVRPLEGASPFLLNFDIRYEKQFENRNELMIAVAYNVFGKRLMTVGSNGIGDSYAMPVNTLNFISKMSFDNNLSVSFKVKNMLNPSIDILQEDKVNIGEYINVSSIKQGIDASVSVGYTIDYKKKIKETKAL